VATQEPTKRQERDARHLREGLLSIPAAAKVLRLSPPRAYGLALDGTFDRRKIGGAVYVTAASVKAYQQARATVPTGWISLPDACRLTGYGRTAILDRVRSGQLERRLVHRRLYLYRPALDAMCQAS
jgi:predicted DNA-binding transcriptional regulator AlpA